MWNTNLSDLWTFHLQHLTLVPWIFFLSKNPSYHFRWTHMILWFSYLCSQLFGGIRRYVFIFVEMGLHMLISERAPESWAEYLLTSLLIALRAPCPSTEPQHSSQRNPRSHSEHVSPLLTLSNGFETSTMGSKTYTDCPPPSLPRRHHFLFLSPSVNLL